MYEDRPLRHQLVLYICWLKIMLFKIHLYVFIAYWTNNLTTSQYLNKVVLLCLMNSIIFIITLEISRRIRELNSEEYWTIPVSDKYNSKWGHTSLENSDISSRFRNWYLLWKFSDHNIKQLLENQKLIYVFILLRWNPLYCIVTHNSEWNMWCSTAKCVAIGEVRSALSLPTQRWTLHYSSMKSTSATIASPLAIVGRGAPPPLCVRPVCLRLFSSVRLCTCHWQAAATTPAD